MTKGTFSRAVDNIDPGYVSEALNYKEKSGKANSRFIKRLTLISAAAVLAAAAVAFGVILAAKINSDNPSAPPELTGTTPPYVETKPNEVTDTEAKNETPLYTAFEIGGLFNERREGNATNVYTKIYVPSENELKYRCMPVPRENTTGIYKIRTDDVKRTEDKSFSMGQFWDKVCASLDVTTDKYGNYHGKDYFISFNDSDDYCSTFSINFIKSDGSKMIFDGVEVTVDQTRSDEEMKASLEPIRKKLCETFNVDLPDIDIVREYDGYNRYGCTFLTVIFYNKEKNGVDINICGFCSDNIVLRFTNNGNYDGAFLSGDVLTRAAVYYRHVHCEPEAICERICDTRLISLTEAEELLYNGYVFGGHICPLCKENQEKVSFEDYDRVGIVYVSGIPFYAFFKNLNSETKNGNAVYARALVCAVEVSDYEEYFTAQEAEHVRTR